MRRAGAQHCVDRDFLGGLAHDDVIGADQTRLNRDLRLGAAFEQATLDQQAIGALASSDQALGHLHRLGSDVLAERLEHLSDDAFGVEPRSLVHGGRRILVDKYVGQYHRAHLQTAVEHALLG
jgi:hypothetical protein